METLNNLNKAANEYHKIHLQNGGASEFDQSINEISRKKIEVFSGLNEKCFLYKINKWNESDLTCVEYTGQKVYNFEFDFMLNERNEEIINIINERNRPHEKYDGKRNMWEVEIIYNIVDKLNGIYLSWV